VGKGEPVSARFEARQSRNMSNPNRKNGTARIGTATITASATARPAISRTAAIRAIEPGICVPFADTPLAGAS
jgi:hypothetical protein